MKRNGRVIEWSDEDIKIIKNMYNNFVHIKDIANYFNVNEKTITKLSHEYGFYFKRKIPKSEEQKLKISKSKKQTNKYKIFEDYIIGYTNNGYEFYIDKEDLDLIKQYCWHKHRDGYLRTRYNVIIDENGNPHNKYILMHKLLTQGFEESNLEIDHINGKPNDNRKSNLREISHSNNMKNIKLSKSNKSGVKGVYYNKLEKKWKSYISYNGKQINLGTFSKKEDAINIRILAENKYYKNFTRKKEDLLNGTR